MGYPIIGSQNPGPALPTIPDLDYILIKVLLPAWVECLDEHISCGVLKFFVLGKSSDTHHINVQDQYLNLMENLHVKLHDDEYNLRVRLEDN